MDSLPMPPPPAIAASPRSHDEAPLVGLIAGWGSYPRAIAEEVRSQGYRIATLGILDHADPALAELCDEFAWIRLGEIGGALRRFRRWGVRRAVLAGKIHKVTFYQSRWMWRHRPDWTGLRTFYRHFIVGNRDRKDDTLLGAVTAAFAGGGVSCEPATNFAPHLLAPAGQLAGSALTVKQQRDVDFGWQLAKQMGGLDVGQAVCVKDQAVLAVEAIEGTDDCIRRAGAVCPQGGFVVVKTAKPQQDMRFDVPTIGVSTLQTLAAAGGAVLAVEAQRTILLDRGDFRPTAERLKLKVVACQRTSTSAAAA